MLFDLRSDDNKFLEQPRDIEFIDKLLLQETGMKLIDGQIVESEKFEEVKAQGFYE